jgi:uncharacterized protein (TIRG00374 family)
MTRTTRADTIGAIMRPAVLPATSTPPDPPIVPPSAGRWYRLWRVARYFVVLALTGVAIWAVSGKTDELRGASNYLNNLQWGWLLPAALAEALSFLAFAKLQRRLLQAGGTEVPVTPMAGVSLAATAIQDTVPGGVILAAAYQYRQYRRFGASDVLSGWVLLAVNAVSFIALSAVAAVGLALAFGTGSALDLVEVILGIAGAAALLVLVWLKRIWLVRHVAVVLRLSQRVTRRPTGDADQVVGTWLERLGAISPGRSDWLWASAYGLANWVADLACLTLAFVAVGADLPWRGLLLAYGAGQLASNLPITPGGLGVVEGSLTVALVTFGGAEASTVAAVLLYRLFNFWLLLPVGWGAWGILAIAGRRRRALETAAPATVEAGGET